MKETLSHPHRSIGTLPQRQAGRVAGDAGRHRVRRRPDLWRVRPAEL
jgi:hypothetical protein